MLFVLLDTAFADMKPVKTFADRNPIPYNGNKLGFVYGGAITENVKGKVNVHPITYELNRIRIAADATYQGESGEEPRYIDIPFSEQKIFTE